MEYSSLQHEWNPPVISGHGLEVGTRVYLCSTCGTRFGTFL